MSSPIATAIVGCGRIAGAADSPRADGPVATHAQAYTRDSRFALTAIAEPDDERRRRFQDTWRVPHAYASLTELLAGEQPRVVSVCSNTAQHASQIVELLRAGSAGVIFAEKPVCRTPEELQALRLAASPPGAPRVLVNHSRRFDPAHRRAAALIADGTLGEFVAGRGDYYGGWLHNGSHLIDTLRLLLGDVTVERVAPGAPGRLDDPCLEVRLRTTRGAGIELHGFDERHYQLFEIDLRFSAGRLLFRDFGEQIVVEERTTNAIGERFLAPRAGSPWRGLETPLPTAVDAIARHLTGDARALAPFGAELEDSARTMGVLWQALAQV
jgi:predicted dehydrogenase